MLIKKSWILIITCLYITVFNASHAWTNGTRYKQKPSKNNDLFLEQEDDDQNKEHQAKNRYRSKNIQQRSIHQNNIDSNSSILDTFAQNN